MGKGNGEPLRTFQTIISDLSILTSKKKDAINPF